MPTGQQVQRKECSEIPHTDYLFKKGETVIQEPFRTEFKASTGAKSTNLVVVSLLSIITLPSDIAILNLYQ